MWTVIAVSGVWATVEQLKIVANSSAMPIGLKKLFVGFMWGKYKCVYPHYRLYQSTLSQF
jgi:hypothetical protein